MILNSEISSSNTKIKDSDHNIKDSDHNIKASKVKTKTLYLGIMCFATNCLSSITLEAGSRGLFRSNSPKRSAIFNNLFRQNYNLRIKIMVADILAALISTTMLTVGDMYGNPYLYLPWLVNTIEGMIFYEGPALFELACILPNGSVPAGLFIFLTLIFYVEELCIWIEIFINFKRCWKNYNINNKLNIESTKMDKELSKENKENLNIISRKLEEQEHTSHSNISNNHNIIQPIVKPVKSKLPFTNRRSKSLLTEVTG